VRTSRTLVFGLVYAVSAVSIHRDAFAQSADDLVIAVENGLWFNGTGFDDRTFYIRSGYLQSTRPARVDSVLDLRGRFVIPPLGDAHTHNLDGEFGIEQVSDAYRSEGTFYVQVLTNTASGAARVRSRFGGRCSIDVVYANGGITSTLSHPFLAYEPRAMGLYADWEAHADAIRTSRLRENDAYWFVDDEEDLARKWPSIEGARPGILKVFLLDAIEAPPEIPSAGLPSGRGLRPSLVPRIVRLAHEAGLRVAAHVETAKDFDVAVRAGVQVIAHMPGYDLGSRDDGSSESNAATGPFEVSDDMAREAGHRGTVVTPTVGWTFAATGPDSARLVARRHDLMRRNLSRLREHGVTMVLGSDWYGATGWHEMQAMRELGTWSDRELLTMWAVDTPRSIFPDRRIGRLDDGYEASFLVLRNDPTRSIDALKGIELRVKQGCVLDRP
jgi:imidazolonepropionase-like amidohydrolase